MSELLSVSVIERFLSHHEEGKLETSLSRAHGQLLARSVRHGIAPALLSLLVRPPARTKFKP